MNCIKISSDVYTQIENTIGALPPEQGGILGEQEDKITFFQYDFQSISTSNTYSPNVKLLNNTILKWIENDVSVFGIIHSHPYGCLSLSYADQIYMQDLIKANKMKQLIAVLVQSKYDSPKFLMKAFVASKEKMYFYFEEIKIKII